MSTVNSFDKNAHFGELNTPLIGTAEGVITPAERKSRALENLGAAAGSLSLFTQVTPATATGTATLTAAQLLTGLIVATPAAAATYTLPLATDLEAALIAANPNIQLNAAFELTIVNVATTDAFDITIATNTGWTLVGHLTIQANEAVPQDGDSAATFIVRRVSSTAYTLYRAT